jgi:hypothetical protein
MHVFLACALVGGEWSASRPGHFNPGKRAPGTHWIGGLVGARTDLDDVERRNLWVVVHLHIPRVFTAFLWLCCYVTFVEDVHAISFCILI